MCSKQIQKYISWLSQESSLVKYELPFTSTASVERMFSDSGIANKTRSMLGDINFANTVVLKSSVSQMALNNLDSISHAYRQVTRLQRIVTNVKSNFHRWSLLKEKNNVSNRVEIHFPWIDLSLFWIALLILHCSQWEIKFTNEISSNSQNWTKSSWQLFV